MLNAKSLRLNGNMIVSVLNSKGGTGKTTTAVNLSSYLALGGQKVLIVDLDGQAAATKHLGFDFDRSRHVTTVYESLVSALPLEKAILPTSVKNLFLAPSNINLSGGEIELHYLDNSNFVVRKVLSRVKGYDYIILDCAPTLSTLLINALVACDLAIVPIQAEFFSMNGLASLLRIMELVEKKLRKHVEFRILFTMFDKRLRLTREVEAALTKQFPDKIFKTKIPKNIRLAEAPSFGVPIALYDPKCKGAKAYRALAQEIDGVAKK